MTAAHTRPFVGSYLSKRLNWCLVGDAQSSPAGCWLCCFPAMTSVSCKRQYLLYINLLCLMLFYDKYLDLPIPLTKRQYVLVVHCFIDFFEASVGGDVGVSALSSVYPSLYCC